MKQPLLASYGIDTLKGVHGCEAEQVADSIDCADFSAAIGNELGRYRAP